MTTDQDHFAARRALLAESAHTQSPETEAAAQAAWREHAPDDARSYADLPEHEKALWRYTVARKAAFAK